MAEVFIRTHAQGFDIVKPFISVWDTRNLTTGSSADNQIRLPLVSDGVYNFTVDWGDGTSNTITAWNQAETTKTYAVPGIYTVQITGNIRGFAFQVDGDQIDGDRNKIIEVRQCGCLVVFGINVFTSCNNLVWTATDRLMTTGNDIGGLLRTATLANSTSIVNRNPSCTSETVTNYIMNRHICCKTASVINIRRFSVR